MWVFRTILKISRTDRLTKNKILEIIGQIGELFIKYHKEEKIILFGPHYETHSIYANRAANYNWKNRRPYQLGKEAEEFHG